MKVNIISKINRLDIEISKTISSWTGNYFIDSIMYWTSRSGEGHAYILLGAVFTIYDKYSGIKIFIASLTSFLIELLIQKSIKHTIKRERPAENIKGIDYKIQPPDSFSFPSGHAAAAFMIAAVFSYYYNSLWPVFYSWAIMISFSRIYNGVHYFSDVIFGGALGYICAHAGIMIIESSPIPRFLT